MTHFIIECMLIAAGCGIVAAIYRGILAYEPVMQWWFRFGNRFENRWFFLPIWGCIKCISGQFGLWAYVFLEILPWFLETKRPFLEIPLLLFGLLLTICGSILTAIVLYRIIRKIENR